MSIEEFSWVELKRSAAEILLMNGYSTSSTTPFNVLTHVFKTYILRIIELSGFSAQLNNRAELQISDVFYACRNLGISREDLEEHMKIFPFTEPARDVPQYPVRRAWKINVPAPYEYSESIGEPFLQRETRLLGRNRSSAELEDVFEEETERRKSRKRKKHKKKKKKRKRREEIDEGFSPPPEP